MGLYRQNGYSEAGSGQHSNYQMSTVAKAILHEDDASSWEEAFIGVPHVMMHADRATVSEEHEKDANSARSVLDEKSSDDVISESLRLDHVRSNLVALRDAVVIPERHSQQTAAERVKGYNPDTTEPQEGREEMQQPRRNLREGRDEPWMTEPGPDVQGENTHFSWTVRSQKGCRVEEVIGQSFTLDCQNRVCCPPGAEVFALCGVGLMPLSGGVSTRGIFGLNISAPLWFYRWFRQTRRELND